MVMGADPGRFLTDISGAVAGQMGNHPFMRGSNYQPGGRAGLVINCDTRGDRVDLCRWTRHK